MDAPAAASKKYEYFSWLAMCAFSNSIELIIELPSECFEVLCATVMASAVRDEPLARLCGRGLLDPFSARQRRRDGALKDASLAGGSPCIARLFVDLDFSRSAANEAG